MVPTETEFSHGLARPHDVVQSLYGTWTQVAVITDATDECGGRAEELVPRVSNYYRSLFRDPERLSRIPYFSPENAEELFALSQSDAGRDGGILVRWRCMVQDTGLGCEVFLASTRDQATDKPMCGLFGGDARGPPAVFADEAAAQAQGALCERTVLCGVSLPGETLWAHRLATGVPHEQRSAEVEAALSRITLNGAASSSVERMRRAPLAEQASVSALVKVYDVDFAEQLKTTEVVDMIGVLDVGVMPYADWQSCGTDAPEEPPATVPCIHAMLLDRSSPSAVLLPLISAAQHWLSPPFSSREATRDALISYIATALGNDRLAAEFCLLALIARIHQRRSGIALGSLSLNLSNVVAAAPGKAQLTEVLETLCPAVVSQSLALGQLNDERAFLFPRSTDAGLQPGRLQLPDGTCVVVDEVAMGEGELKDAGVRNVRALASVLQQHKLPYAFPFSEFEFNTDLNVVVLSTGKTLLPADVQVPVRPDTGATSLDMRTRTISEPPNTEQLDAFRIFLLQARQAQCIIPESISEYIQNDFVDRRQTNKEAYTQDDLQLRIGIARLMCALLGREQLDVDAYNRAKELDEQRKARFT